MALTQTFFKSFEQVEAHYNSIKPIRGRGDMFGPIVPIGDRRRKFERIIKLNDCYVLDDGWHMGSPNYYYDKAEGVLYKIGIWNTMRLSCGSGIKMDVYQYV